MMMMGSYEGAQLRQAKARMSITIIVLGIYTQGKTASQIRRDSDRGEEISMKCDVLYNIMRSNNI